jgi:hypothetical protein
LRDSGLEKGCRAAPGYLLSGCRSYRRAVCPAFLRLSEPGGHTILVELDQSRLATLAGAGAGGDLGGQGRPDRCTEWLPDSPAKPPGTAGELMLSGSGNAAARRAVRIERQVAGLARGVRIGLLRVSICKDPGA